MEGLNSVLEKLETLDLEELQEKCVDACKMLFCLFECIHECCDEKGAKDIWNMFESIVKFED
jgi:hypothetical protein